MISLSDVQDQCQRLKAEGKTPMTIILCQADYEKLPKSMTQLYGLRVVRSANYPVSQVVAGVFEKMTMNNNKVKARY